MNKHADRQPARTYHCDTCGARYSSTGYEDERADGMMIWRLDEPHQCKLQHGVFFERTEREYQYREGVLQSREVTYRVYSGHDTGVGRLVASTSWAKHTPDKREIG